MRGVLGNEGATKKGKWDGFCGIGFDSFVFFLQHHQKLAHCCLLMIGRECLFFLKEKIVLFKNEETLRANQDPQRDPLQCLLRCVERTTCVKKKNCQRDEASR